MSESGSAVICCSSPRLTGWFQGEANRPAAGAVPEAAQVRLVLALSIAFFCTGCAFFQKPAAQAPAPQQAAVPANPPPVADAASPRFECSDGTVSISQDGCLVAMARARLPPAQTIERTPASPSGTPR